MSNATHLREINGNYYFRYAIPMDVRSHYGNKAEIQFSLNTSERKEAVELARHHSVQTKAAINAFRGYGALQEALMAATENEENRKLYTSTLTDALSGKLDAHGSAVKVEDENGEFSYTEDPTDLGISLSIDAIADEAEAKNIHPLNLPGDLQAPLDALQDAQAIRNGDQPSSKIKYKASPKQMTKDYMRYWNSLRQGRPVNNRPSQIEATLKLLHSYLKAKPLSALDFKTASDFLENLQKLDPNYARSAASRELSFDALCKRFHGTDKFLSAGTMNRHLKDLKQFIKWAVREGHFTGENPFERDQYKGLVERYVPWTIPELNTLFEPGPPRLDLREVMLVALYTGMRCSEIAILGYEDIKLEGTVWCFDIKDAKTRAGVRKVPIHKALNWLAARKRRLDKSEGRIWERLNEEGPSKSPGADASKMFSAYKISKGFKQREKCFHSFRKNITTVAQQKGIPETSWSPIIGHTNPNMTYGVYSAGLTLEANKDAVDLIEYEGLQVQHPEF